MKEIFFFAALLTDSEKWPNFFSFKMFLISRLSAAYNETSVFSLRFFFPNKYIFFGVFQIKIVIRCESIFTHKNN